MFHWGDISQALHCQDRSGSYCDRNDTERLILESLKFANGARSRRDQTSVQ